MNKIIPLILFSLLSLAMAEEPWTKTNRYKTLGYQVIEYSRQYEKAYQIFDDSGNLVAECNLAGFIEWKKRRLMFLIGQPSTSVEEREQYKLQYEELSRRQDASTQMIANVLLAKQQMRQQNFQYQTNQLMERQRARTEEIYRSKN